MNLDNIPASDYEWQDEKGNVLTQAPTDAGTYYIALTPAGVTQLAKDNPNYNVTESGKFKFVISPAEATITVTGSDENTKAEFTSDNTYGTTGSTGITLPEGLTYQIVGNPTESGVYDVTLSDASQQALNNANPNYSLTFTSTAKFTLDATLTITFEDTTDGNKTVKTVTKTGVNGSTDNNLGLSLPENYALAPGQTLPTSYTFGKDLQQSLNIKLVHGTKTVDPTKPNTNPDPDDKNWFKQNDLTKDITRTINYSGLSDAQLAQIPADQKGTQTVEFTRTASYDLVTGKLVAGSEGEWTALDGKNTWAGFTPKEFAGYTADKTVPEVTVKSDDKNSSITITYTADAQSVAIKFVDDDKGGAQVGQIITKNGQTDQNINNLGLTVPDHYKLAAGQSLPTSYKFTSDKDQTITIHLVEKTDTVDPTKPNTNPDPKNNDWFKDHDLSKTVTRTINDELPTGTKTETQSVTITRTATYNEVTGELTNYGTWTTAQWPSYTAKGAAGYTPSQAEVSAATVTDQTQPTTVNITYTANDQTGKISYVDDSGKEISTTPLAGKTDEKVNVTPEAPTGWKIVPGQDIPKTVTATADGIPTVTVKIEHNTTPVPHTDPVPENGKTPTGKPINGAHQSDLNQTITRTINVTTPDGQTTTTKQVARIFRDATYDDVTGDVTYGKWSTDNTAWKDLKPTAIAGYTPSQADVPAVVVKNGQADQTINITYTADAQSVAIKFVDDDKGGAQVGQIITKNGQTDQTINNLGLTVPDHYKLAAGQSLPTSYKFTSDKDQTITIHLTEKTITVDPTDPTTNPDPQNNDWFKDHDLTKTVTRTINDELPTGTKSTTQSAMITRTATYNEVTGELTNLGAWTTAQWPSYTAQGAAGYTPSQAEVSAATVTDQTQPTTVNITYTANDQNGKISYVDDSGKEIGTTPLAGKTGESVTVTPQAPTGWKIVPGQEIPKTVTATADGIPTVTVKIEHAKTDVPHTDPVPENGKTPTGKPINGAHQSDLNQTITRTINVTTPDGQTTTTKQVAHIYRDATYDDVTGDVTYGKWSTATWDSYTPADIKGYTPSQAEVAQETVKNGMTNQTVDITYNPIPGPKDGQQVVQYVDPDGHVVTTQTITGKQGDDVPFTPQVPDNWNPVDDVPSTIKISGGTTTILIKHKTAEASDSRTVTRTIVEELPSGTKTETQTATISRTGVKDLVTGETSWNGWTTSQWNEFTPEVPTGYTPSQSVVAQMPVNAKTQDTTVTITYTKIPQPQNGEQIISYQDKDGHIIHTQTVTGKQGDDVPFTPEVPENWQPVNGVPTKVKIDGSTTVILIEPQTKPVKDQKTITRTIIEHLPNGKDQTVKQTVTLTMTGTKNLVTGETTDVTWTNGKFDEFTPEAVPGYTPSQAVVPTVVVNADMTDQTVNINYTADAQTVTIKFVDDDNHEQQVGKLITEQGVTNETIDHLNLTVPAHYHLADGQKLPTSYKFTAAKDQMIMIHLVENTTTVNPTDPQTNPDPQNTDWFKDHDLTKTINRTIVDQLPSGTRQVTQTATIYRTATYNEATGALTNFSDWSTADWPAYQVDDVPGYTTHITQTVNGQTTAINEIADETVTDQTQPTTITITYTKNSTPVVPDHPDNPDNPDNPNKPDHPDQPGQPDQPGHPGNGNHGGIPDQGGKQPGGSVVPGEGQSGHNDGQANKQASRKLPQTGNDQGASLAALGALGLATMLGLAKRKKRQD